MLFTYTVTNNHEAIEWHVMYGRYATLRVLDELQLVKSSSALPYQIHDYFVPLQYKLDKRRQLTRCLVPGSYIFLKASYNDINAMKQSPLVRTDIRYVRNASESFMTISDHELNNFRNVINVLNEKVEYVNVTHEMEKGDHVRVVSGPFKGAEGILETRRGHQGSAVLVTISNLLAVRTLKVSIEDLRYVELNAVSRNYKRMKEFLQRSYDALRNIHTLSAEEFVELQNLVNAYGELDLSGKLQLTHAEAMCNALRALGKSGTTQYFKYYDIMRTAHNESASMPTTS